jgi:hypothetical protein
MSENVEVKTEDVVVETPQLNEVEQEAYKEGWRPKDEFEGDPNRWIPADEFMRRAPLFEKIEELKSRDYHNRKEIQEVKQTLKALSEHHKTVRQQAYKDALRELQSQRKEAMEERDHDTVIRLEEEIDTLKDERREFEQQVKQETAQQVAKPSPEFVDWVKDNEWYNTDFEMRSAADGIALSFLQNAQKNGQQVNPAAVYDHVSKSIRKVFSNKFEPKGPKISPVDSGNNTGRAPSRKSSYQLSPEEEQVARQFEKTGVMTRDEYVAELQKLDKEKK